MNKTLFAFVLAALVACGLAAPSSAATNGDGTLVLTTQNVSLWPGYCGDSSYTISGSYNQAPHWDVEITVSDPHGRWAGGDYFYDSDPGSTGSTNLCVDYDLPGTYRVTATYEMYDSEYNQIGANTVTSSFTLSTKAKYASTLRGVKTKYGKHGWKVAGTVTQNGKAWAGHSVQIQAYAAGAWRTLLTKTADRYGRVTFFSTPKKSSKKTYLCRLHSAGGTYARDANSATFTLKRRR